MLWRLTTANRQPPSVQLFKSAIDFNAEPPQPEKYQDDEQQQKKHKHLLSTPASTADPALYWRGLHFGVRILLQLRLCRTGSRTLRIDIFRFLPLLPFLNFR